MGVDASELFMQFLSAVQAAFSVLLTIVFGVVAAQCNLLSTNAAKEVSKLCVRMFLPALLISSEDANVKITLWSISYTLLSVLLGRLLTRFFKLPAWVTPAITFNNTTSLPLLLIRSLRQTRILDAILIGGESGSTTMDRAESCFLINAMVSISLTFALGPRLLKPGDEDAPDKEEGIPDEGEEEEQPNVNRHGENGEIERGPDGLINEETSLLPQRIIRPTNRMEKKSYLKTQNCPSNEGGYFNAWLTTAIKNIGELFPSTQIIVVGVKLSQSMLRMKRGEGSGEVHKGSLALDTFCRFIIWPIISIPLIWVVASKNKLLDADPMLWFSMMLMPTGPPAMILVALTDVTGAPESMKMTIAKFLTVSYAITPMICFAVVGALNATEAALQR
ncbi:hypothetical protein EJ02DRAFT_507362 [Clathrospora elynae]|uniref:Auxin efflux carrier n=1 Tax=Clathrospora elynae TaxID=706981 RepID=A0A6A5S5A0_9PLEO|nr:hypothetical protein EJ02DRAFT_507362 [Clathrospora elynae]